MLAVLCTCAGHAQTPAPTPAKAATPEQQTKLDRVVAIVNNDLILDSDVDEERRLEALQPYRETTEAFSRDKTIERLIDRDLILQQVELQAQDPITDAQLNHEIDALRKTIPDCKNRKFDCETKAGWDSVLCGQRLH